MNVKEKQLNEKESILIEQQKLSNYRLEEENEVDQESSTDEPFEPYYITEDDT